MDISIDDFFIIVSTSILNLVQASFDLMITGHHRKKWKIEVTYEEISQEILRETYSKASFTHKLFTKSIGNSAGLQDLKLQNIIPASISPFLKLATKYSFWFFSL